MQTIEQTTRTAMRELTTSRPESMKTMSMTELSKWSDWLKFQTCGDPKLEKMVMAVKQWAMAVKQSESPRWISFVGTCGNGKTHCGQRLFDWSKDKFNWTKFSYIPHRIYWPEFVQHLRSGDAFTKRTEMNRWPVLFLDDIGAERDPNGFAAEELNTLLGCRMDQWTILTSNKTMDALEAVDARIASRIKRGKNILVKCDAEDFALRN
jgi:DNA replication protein DnaC